MSAKAPIVNTGDVLKIPALSEDEKAKQIMSIEWSQDYGKKYKEDYCLVKATNQSRGGIEVPVYIQKDKYTGAFELKVDNKVQYGQKNKEGENRFAVYHDTSRKPFQHRFIASTVGAMIANAAGYTATVASTAYPRAEIVSTAVGNLKSVFGDDLHTF